MVLILALMLVRTLKFKIEKIKSPGDKVEWSLEPASRGFETSYALTHQPYPQGVVIIRSKVDFQIGGHSQHSFGNSALGISHGTIDGAADGAANGTADERANEAAYGTANGTDEGATDGIHSGMLLLRFYSR